MERSWRLLTHWGGEAGYHMGLDETLLLSGGRPTLRFYSWEPWALSLGYFQRRADVPAAARVASLVRRQTGGGAIHHAEELTFSLTTELEDPLYQGPVAASYHRIHDALAQAFMPLGVKARRRGTDAVRSERAGTGMCFHVSTAEDLCWDGAKGVGSAQRRTGGRVLHHGSIKLAMTEFEEGVATLRTHAPSLTVEDLAEHVRAAFEEYLGLSFEPGLVTAAEEREAGLRAQRFRSDDFVNRR